MERLKHCPNMDFQQPNEDIEMLIDRYSGLVPSLYSLELVGNGSPFLHVRLRGMIDGGHFSIDTRVSRHMLEAEPSPAISEMVKHDLEMAIDNLPPRSPLPEFQ